MRIHIEPTTRIVDVVGTAGIVPARVWEGETDNGIAITVLVTRIAARIDADRSELERTLEEQHPPSIHADAWPNRLIL